MAFYYRRRAYYYSNTTEQEDIIGSKYSVLVISKYNASLHGPMTPFQRSTLFGMTSRGEFLYTPDVLRLEPATNVPVQGYVISNLPPVFAYLPLNSVFDNLGPLLPDHPDPRFILVAAPLLSDDQRFRKQVVRTDALPIWNNNKSKAGPVRNKRGFIAEMPPRTVIRTPAAYNMCEDERAQNGPIDQQFDMANAKKPDITPTTLRTDIMPKSRLLALTDMRLRLSGDTTDRNLEPYNTQPWPNYAEFSRELCDYLQNVVRVNGVDQRLRRSPQDKLGITFLPRIIEQQYLFPANVDVQESTWANVVYRIIASVSNVRRDFAISEEFLDRVLQIINDYTDRFRAAISST